MGFEVLGFTSDVSAPINGSVKEGKEGKAKEI